MKNTTITETIVVKIDIKSGDKVIDTFEREFAFIEDAEAHFNFDSEGVKVFRRKAIVEEEEIV